MDKNELDGKEDAPEDTKDTGKEKDEIKLSETELAAVQQGWVPKDQWKGDPEDWTPAKQFLKYGDIEAELKRERKEKTHLNKVVSKMKDFYSNVKEDAKKEILDSLKRSKRDALAKEDYEEVAKIDAQMELVEEGITRTFKKADEEVKKVDEGKPAEPIPEFYEWHKENKWYKLPDARTGADEASEFADEIAIGYVSRKQGASPADVYKYVTERMKKAFPELYSNPARKQPSAVDDGGGEKVGGKTKDTVKLTAEEKAAADNFGLSYEKYAEHLKSYEKMKGRA
jgi:hypothetical protein